VRVIRENCKREVTLTLQWNVSEHRFGVCIYNSVETPAACNGRIIFKLEESLHKMMTGKLTIKQQRFLELYLGAEPGQSGNSTKSYMAAYGCSEKCAGASGPRLLANVRIKEAIAKHQERVQEKVDVTAATVLQDAIRFRDIAFGDVGAVEEKLVEDKETSEFYIKVFHVRRFNAQAVGKAIELMGRNCVVQAFQESVEVSHVHYLEEALNRRLKDVEDAAAKRKRELVD
jgi:phage terminase small subunit